MIPEDFFSLVYNDNDCRILYLKKNKVLSRGQILLPTGVVSSGKILQPEVFARTIQVLLSQVKGQPVRTKNIVAALPEEKVFIQVIEIPKVPEEKVFNVIKWQAEKLISFPLENVYLDHHVIADLGNKLKVLITASQKEIIDPLLISLNSIGLNLIALDSRSGALARLYAKTEHSLVVIVDIEKFKATVIIAKNYIARLSAIIVHNGNSKLIEKKIVETINFYLSRKEVDKKIDQVILLGNVESVDKIVMMEGLKITVEIGTFKKLTKIEDNGELNPFIANLGLYSKLGAGINLLPYQVKTNLYAKKISQLIQNYLNYSIALVIFLVIIALGIFAWQSLTKIKLNQNLTLLDNQTSFSQSKIIEDKVVSLNSKISHMKELAKNNQTFGANLTSLITNLPPETKINGIKYSQESQTINLQGNVSNRQKLLLVVDTIKNLPTVLSVDLPLKNYENNNDINYEINIKIK